jgi:large subunit ribosomal protein L21
MPVAKFPTSPHPGGDTRGVRRSEDWRKHMYAIVESGGKQYKAVPGTTIEVDRLHVDEGAQIDLDQVLLVADDGDINVGTPMVKGATVKATVVEHFKGKKIIVFKYIPRERYRRKRGHRQQFTRLQIDDISVK